jgi:hypothetical protein
MAKIVNNLKEEVEKVAKETGKAYASEVYVCKSCGNPHVEEEAWVTVNTRKFIELCENETDYYWCSICGSVQITTYGNFMFTKDKPQLTNIITGILAANITGEEMEVILELVGQKEQMSKQLLGNLQIEHRMTMIKDEVNELRRLILTTKNDSVDTCFSNIEIAADLSSDECYDWIPYSTYSKQDE